MQFLNSYVSKENFLKAQLKSVCTCCNAYNLIQISKPVNMVLINLYSNKFSTNNVINVNCYNF